MTAWTHRPLASAAEFPVLRETIREAWRLAGPLPFTAPGPLDWWRVRNPSADLPGQIDLWFRDDGPAPVGWAWDFGEEVEWFAVPGLEAADDLRLRAAMIERVKARAAASGTPEKGFYATEECPTEAAALEAAGAERKGEHVLGQFYASLPADLPPEPALPPGYAIRPVELAAEFDARVELHRAAFAPSKFTAEKLRGLLVDGSAYDPALDLVVVAPDGALAAFAIGWADEPASVGEIEPLGVHPDHRGRGLARALVRAHVRGFARRGLKHAAVWHVESNAPAAAAYAGAGLRPIARAVDYVLRLS